MTSYALENFKMQQNINIEMNQKLLKKTPLIKIMFNLILIYHILLSYIQENQMKIFKDLITSRRSTSSRNIQKPNMSFLLRTHELFRSTHVSIQINSLTNAIKWLKTTFDKEFIPLFLTLSDVTNDTPKVNLLVSWVLFIDLTKLHWLDYSRH